MTPMNRSRQKIATAQKTSSHAEARFDVRSAAHIRLSIAERRPCSFLCSYLNCTIRGLGVTWGLTCPIIDHLHDQQTTCHASVTLAFHNYFRTQITALEAGNRD